ncbi:MAG: c-type cytochrome, partial [Acetobacteraceae bacterium]
MKSSAAALGLAISLGLEPGPAEAAPTDPGARLWLQCRACHSLKAGEPNKIGPNLHGIMGAKAGSRPGFRYSAPMKASGIVWTDASLDAWLTKPMTMVKGTKMSFAAEGMPAKDILVPFTI